jgi:opacity protein-like surface antigen
MRNRLLAVITLVLAAPAVGAAQETAPAQPAPAPTAATPPPPAKSEPERSSYVVLKGGYFGSTGDFQGSSLSGNGTFEAAIGYGRVFGLELASGYMKATASGLKVETIPLLLSLRFALPIAFLAPFAEAGAGACYNKATIGGTSDSGWTAEWHAGAGLDFLLGPLLLGAEARYMGFSQSFSNLGGTVDLHRYAVLVRAGLRF